MRKHNGFLYALTAGICAITMAGCGNNAFNPPAQLLVLGDQDVPVEHLQGVDVSYVLDETTTITKTVPNHVFLDGYNPTRVVDNKIVTAWTLFAQGTTPFHDKSFDELILHPIWTEYDATAENPTAIVYNYTQNPELSSGVSLTVNSTVTTLAFIGNPETTYSLRISVAERTTPLSIYMENMKVSAQSGSPVIDATGADDEAVVSLETKGSCTLSSNGDRVIVGETFSITGEGSLTVNGKSNNSAIDCTNLTISGVSLFVKASSGKDGHNGSKGADGHEGERGGDGQNGGHALCIRGCLQIVNSKVNLECGNGGSGGNGGKGNNKVFGSAKKGGDGGRGGTGGSMIHIPKLEDFTFKACNATLTGYAGSGGSGGRGGEGGGTINKGATGASGSRGGNGIKAEIILAKDKNKNK